MYISEETYYSQVTTMHSTLSAFQLAITVSKSKSNSRLTPSALTTPFLYSPGAIRSYLIKAKKIRPLKIKNIINILKNQTVFTGVTFLGSTLFSNSE